MNTLLKLLVVCILFFSGGSLFGQESLTGRVVDKLGKPIDVAAVYINGTTLRTATTNNGAFELRGVTFPCQLVVSHLGYETLKATIDGAPAMAMLLYMKDKDVALSEVSIEGKDQRKVLLQSFRDNFLGWNTWGKGAEVLNENVLTYQLSYNEDTAYTAFSGDLRQINLPRSIIERTLVVKAKEPLQVDLPLLGYNLTVDLDYLSLIQTIPYYNPVTGITMERFEICRYLGSYSFKPKEDVSKSKQRRFDRNRQDAYYNSTMHFGQSLLKKDLLKNGFLFINKRKDPITNNTIYEWVNLDSCSRFDKNGNLFIYGLAGKSFEIHYFGKANGSPVDMSKKQFSNPVEYANRYRIYYNDMNCSTIYFINDTCIIRKNGTVPDNSISFGGKISYKKVGAILPDDYTPPVE